jgi:DNA-binding MarR family transcriptional regulator
VIGASCSARSSREPVAGGADGSNRIGIDDALTWPYPRIVRNAADAAERFMQYYARTFLLFHRRQTRSEPRLTPQGHMLLVHLSGSGPLTIGELSAHIERTQSVVSEMVDALEGRGLLARVRDPRDRRRTLVWLTDAAIELIAREQEVLDRERLRQALAAMSEVERDRLLAAFEALLRSAHAVGEKKEKSR